MAKSKPGGGSKPSDKNARLERQARELRENLIRRKEQSRARSARQRGLSEPPDDEASGT